jgi:hypothetical protein
MEVIKLRHWFWSNTYLALQSWEPGFDPNKEVVTSQALSVKLSGLVIEIWKEQILLDINNTQCYPPMPRAD